MKKKDVRIENFQKGIEILKNDTKPALINSIRRAKNFLFFLNQGQKISKKKIRAIFIFRVPPPPKKKKKKK